MGAVSQVPDLPRASVEALSRAGLAVQLAAEQVRTWRHGASGTYLGAGVAALGSIEKAITDLERAHPTRAGEYLTAEVARRDLGVLWCARSGCWPPSTPDGAS